MSPERWKQIEELFEAASEMPASERPNYVLKRSNGDPDLASEVNKLLSSLDSADEFIESPVWTDSDFLNTSAKKELSISLDSHFPAGVDEFVGRKIGVYKLTRQIGRGGMGAVYKAERADGEFQQTVAIKLIKRGMDTDFIIRRFRHERQILASFEHPFIARLLDGGTTKDGVPYFVMEYIEGETFYNYCDSKRLTIRDRLKLFQKVCSAIEYAHERQIIHRDIKPSNILINRAGSPKLLDFGIAKILDPDLIHESLNPTGSLLRMMTPDYASPEQVRGRDVTTISDIYSLGVLLYELVTGHRPYNFGGRALHEVSRVVCEEMPRVPSRMVGTTENLLPQYSGSSTRAAEARATSEALLTKELQSGLDDVIMKALSKSPSNRYQSARSLSQDITRFLSGSSVEAPKYKTRNQAKAEVNRRTSEQSKAIAVLPFKFMNLGTADDTDDRFLGLGLTDALIARLSKIRRFMVRPTSSILAFGETITDPIKAGKTLNVDYIIDGNIKKANDRLRVSIQLLNVKDNAAVWATSIDEKLADVLTLEDTLSNKVVEALLPQLTGSDLAEFTKRGTDIPEAFEQYLRGRYYFNSFTEEGLAKAFVAFHTAISADPNYALAYCGIADYYNWLGIIGVLPPQECFLPAIEAASKAVELDNELSEAHATLGFSLHAGNYDWAGAERHLKRAIELNPGNATAFVWYSIVLYTEGRFDEGLELARKGAELDPLTPFNHHNLGFGLYYARQYEAAAAQYEKVIHDFPDYGFGHYGLSKVNRKIGNTEAAIKQNEIANALMGGSFFSRLADAECYASDGQQETALAKVQEMERLAEDRYVSPYQIALVYCYLGDDDKTISYLQKGAEIREAWLNWMGVDPVLDPVRSDPRFEDILENIGYRPLFSNFAKTGTQLANKTTDPATGTIEQPRLHDLTTLVIDEGPITSEVQTGPYSATRNKVFVYAAAALLLIAVAGAGVYYFYSNRPTSQAAIRPVNFQNPAVVVLPFTTGDPADENLGLGLADAMSQRLGYLKGLTVISSNTGRFVQSEHPSRIAEELGVTFILRGALNKTENGAVLDAEFINAPADAIVWRETFTAPDGDYFKVQTQLAQLLVETLGIHPLPMERQQIEKSYTQSFTAYERYLIGRSQMANRDAQGLRRSIGSFASAVEHDPNFAPAYVGLADAHSLLNLYDIRPPEDAYPRAREYAQRALAIDPDLAEAHASLAYIKFYYERDRSGAELEFRRAIQTNPSYAQAHHWFALALAAMGKPVDGLSEIETADRLDPRSLSIKAAAAIVHFFAGQYDEAVAMADRALAIDPRFVPAHKVKRWVFAANGNLAAARESLERERLYSGGTETEPGWQIIKCQLAGNSDGERSAAIKMLEEAIHADEVKANDFYFAFEIALAYNHLGQKDKVFEWLERSEMARTHSFNLMEADPRVANLKNEPRFQRLVRKLHKAE